MTRSENTQTSGGSESLNTPRHISEPDLARAILRSKAFRVVDLADYFRKLGEQSGYPLDNLIRITEKIPFFVNGNEHLTLRRIAMSFFRTDKIRNWDPVILDCVNQALDAMVGLECVDLVSEYAAVVSSTSICQILGLPPAGRKRYDQMAEEIRWVIEPFLPLSQLRRIDEVAGKFYQELASLDREPREQGPQPFLAELTNVPTEFTEADVLWLTIALYVAGQSSLHTLANILVTLAETPAEQRMGLLEPDKLNAIVDALLRTGGSIQYLSRIALNDVKIEDHQFIRGERVEVEIAAANITEAGGRCPFSHATEDTIGIDTITGSGLAFGVGAHKCVGAELTRMVARHALSGIMSRFPLLRALPGSPNDYHHSRAIKSPLDLLCHLS